MCACAWEREEAMARELFSRRGPHLSDPRLPSVGTHRPVTDRRHRTHPAARKGSTCRSSRVVIIVGLGLAVVVVFALGYRQHSALVNEADVLRRHGEGRPLGSVLRFVPADLQRRFEEQGGLDRLRSEWVPGIRRPRVALVGDAWSLGIASWSLSFRFLVQGSGFWALFVSFRNCLIWLEGICAKNLASQFIVISSLISFSLELEISFHYSYWRILRIHRRLLSLSITCIWFCYMLWLQLNLIGFCCLKVLTTTVLSVSNSNLLDVLGILITLLLSHHVNDVRVVLIEVNYAIYITCELSCTNHKLILICHRNNWATVSFISFQIHHAHQMYILECFQQPVFLGNMERKEFNLRLVVIWDSPAHERR